MKHVPLARLTKLSIVENSQSEIESIQSSEPCVASEKGARVAFRLWLCIK